MQVGNGQTFFQTNTASELNGTEKKLERYKVNVFVYFDLVKWLSDDVKWLRQCLDMNLAQGK